MKITAKLTFLVAIIIKTLIPSTSVIGS